MPSLNCKICEKVYSDEKKLQNHTEKKHMLVYKAEITRKPQKRVSFSDHVIVHELKEYHRCRKCTKIFEKYKLLKSHMKQEHRKRKCYICNYCSKDFVDRMFFKVHIKHHCDVCGLLLRNKREFLVHRRDSCRVVKKYTCKTCENKFFSYMDLKDHSYDHLEDLFVCDICKAQHISKCGITHHILFLHSKKRPKKLFTNRRLGKERLYLCKFCEVSSLEKEVIDKHLSMLEDLNNRKYTGYKDYYFCDQCLRKFDTETSMLQHKWSHFLNSSENSQVRPKKRVSKDSTLVGSPRTFKIDDKLLNLKQLIVVVERLKLEYLKPVSKAEIDKSNNLFGDSVENINGQNKEDSVQEIDPLSIKEVDVVAQNVEKIVEKPQEDEIVNVVDLTDEKEVPSGNEEKQMDVTNSTKIDVGLKKAIVNPKSKRTLISNFQCKVCHKYLSSNYCLKRHYMTMHQSYSNLCCEFCEETFVWPSLLKSHKCLRMNIPEMPFDDARPEIQFDNYREFGQLGTEDLMNMTENENYMNSVDFEIPAPVVQLTEYENRGNGINPNINRLSQQLTDNFGLPMNNYKIVMQEVPIEF